MNNDDDDVEFLTYSNGKYLDLALRKVPSWILDSIDSDEEAQTNKLAKVGAILVQNCVYGLQVWKLVNEFFIEYFDGDTVIGRFVICNMRDMMAFEADFISPVTQRLMAEHQYHEWLKDLEVRKKLRSVH